MITGNIRDIDNIHQFNPVIKMAMKDILEQMESALTTCEKHEVLGQDLYWFSVSEKGCESEQEKPEFHEQFVDIEVVLRGRETLGYSETNYYESLADDHILDQDIAFVEGVKDEKYISLGEGEFAIFYPGDLHRACYSPEDEVLTKAVIRINKDLL